MAEETVASKWFQKAIAEAMRAKEPHDREKAIADALDKLVEVLHAEDAG